MLWVVFLLLLSRFSFSWFSQLLLSWTWAWIFLYLSYLEFIFACIDKRFSVNLGSFQTISLWIFFLFHSFLHFFWYSYYMYAIIYIAYKGFYMSLNLCSFFKILFPISLNCIIIDISSGSTILSSWSSNLPLSSSFIILFNSRISSWFFCLYFLWCLYLMTYLICLYF